MPRAAGPSSRPRLHTALLGLLMLAACTAPSPSPSPGAASGGPTSSTRVSDGPAASVGASGSPKPGDPNRISLEEVAVGLSEPINIAAAGDGRDRLFVNERAGLVRVIGGDGTLQVAPFVDLRDRILAGGERGLLGLAFHPRFGQNGRLFVHYSRAGDGATVVSELHAAADLQSADPSSEHVLLTVAQPFSNHNGGQLAFGPDGYLYIGLGDGGGGGDPLGNALNPNALLGKILRIDVDGPPAAPRGYGLPADNMFGPQGPHPDAGLPEIWAMGLRNPWRFSFDAETGDLLIGDVGQGAWEEIDRQPADAPAGRNYGWNQTEGLHCYQSSCDRGAFTDPVAEYGHDIGCSVTGGYVYRGQAQDQLRGVYLFGDYCSGIVFSIQPDLERFEPRRVLESGLAISTFGQGDDGEIYLADILGGTIYHVLAGD